MQELEWTALDRIRQFETQLYKIKSADFIHNSTRRAAGIIEGAMQKLAREVKEAALLEDKQYLVQKAISVNQKLFSYTNYLGILLRSTNVRNCYESYRALSNIVKRLTGKTDQLVISSEWDASPFFIQQPPEILRDFVFIGIPAFASRNALLLPLAAHEIGHAVWRIQEVEGLVYTTADYIVSDHIAKNRDELIQSPTLFQKIDEEELHARIMTMVMSQAQEIFCDLFGAYLFKKSFYYAFCQYLSPGFGRRESSYPSFEYRIRYVRKAAFEGLTDDEPLQQSIAFEGARLKSPPDLTAADAISEKMHSGVCEVVKSILSEAQLLNYSAAEESEVLVCLKSGVPPQKIVSLAVILNAVWAAYRARIFDIEEIDQRHKFTSFMNNLCLKSLEVMDFLLIGAENC